MLGYNGKILEVNLTSNEIKEVTLLPEVYRDYLGGSGLAAKILLDRLSFNSSISPLSAENPLIIMTGPFTSSRLPGSTTRFSVCSISPLTGIWGESSCGGSLGMQLKQTGYDGIVITGAKEEPVYLWIDEGRVEIREARDLWGKDTYEVIDILEEKSKESGKKASVFCIGIAGENLVRYANICNDKCNFAGRCGMGAVMGSKKLKAIVVRGSKKVDFADEEKLDKLRRELIAKIKENIAIQSLSSFGTDSAMELGMMMGDVPIKNWSLGVWDEGSSKLSGPTMADTILTKTHSCFGCPVGCKRVVKVEEEKYKMEEGPGPEYEGVSSLGTLCYNDNLPAVALANELCNRYGIDVISCGGTIAYILECAEKGIKSLEDFGLSGNLWGDADLIIELIHKIAKREGIGDLMAEGSKRMKDRLSLPADFLVEVKGLELPMHDPRAFHGMGLNYAVSNRGACHVHTSQMYVEHGYVFYPELDMEGPYPEQESSGKAELNVKTQNLGMIFNSGCICFLAGIPFSGEDIKNMINYCTGFNFSLSDMMKTGERIWFIKRGINNLLGVTSQDDYLPQKVLTPTQEGGAKGSVPDIELMLKEFYELRKLDEKGRPKKEKLISLGLKDLKDKLYG